MTIANDTLLPLIFGLTTSLAGCVIEVPSDEADDEAGDTSGGDTSEGGTSEDDTSGGDTSGGDTEDTSEGDTTTGGEPICPGSEEYCTEESSWCSSETALELCLFDGEMGCISFAGTVDCVHVGGEGSTCETQTATTADCTTPHIRFVNLSDGVPIDLVIKGGQGSYFLGTLDYGQVHPYDSFFNSGVQDIDVYDEQGNVLTSLHGHEFAVEKKYTVAVMGLHMDQAQVWVHEDAEVDAIDVAADHARVTLVNALPEPGNLVDADLAYSDFLGLMVADSLDYAQDAGLDAPLPTPEQAPDTLLSGSWSGPTHTGSWFVADALLGAAGESFQLFMTCTGSCVDEADLQALVVREDSSVLLLEPAG